MSNIFKGIQLNELSPQTLASYKKKAGAEASQLDKDAWAGAPDAKDKIKKANKRFSGVVKATKKEFDNDAKGIKEDAEQLHVGDPVVITGDVQFNGATGDIIGFGRDNRFVIVDLYNHGKHSFHSSDVSFNDHEDSDEHEIDEAGDSYWSQSSANRQQASMDAQKRDFKRREMEHELGHEDEQERREQNTTYYILINGKVLKKDGVPYHYRGKAAAMAAAKTMMGKEWNKGKNFHVSATPEDKPEYAAKPQTAPAQATAPASNKKVFTFFDIGRSGKSFTDAQLQQMGLRKTQGGKWYAPTDNPSTISSLEQQLNVKGKSWTCPVKEHIVKHGSGYRLLSKSGKNLGTFPSHKQAAKHEGEVEYFKSHPKEGIEEAEGTPEGLPRLTKKVLNHIIQQVGTEGAHAIVKSLEWGDGAAKDLLKLIVKDLKQDVAEGAEEDSYSDKFVQSQIDYYKKHGLSGNNSDRLRINGALNQYQRIKNKRIKDGTWSLDQGVAEDMPPPENARKTQIAGTLPTYKKAADILNKTGVKGKALDFGAGLGMGTGELGPDAHSYEPFPGDKFKPHFVDVTKIPDNSYHKIVNLNVLNVVPNTGEHKIRDSIVKNIGRVLAPGGVALITTRGKDVLTIKGTPGEEPTSMISKIGTYQKGFTQKELLQYIQQTLGKGFEVSSIKLGPAGVMIKKLDHEDVAEGKEFGEGDIQRWALKSPENKEIYDEYAKVNQLAKKAWADKDGAAYTGLQNKRYYLRKLIGQKMSEQGVAEDDQQSTSVIPNVVYHGSPSDFNEFDPYATMDGGFYFTSDKKLALSFSKDEDGEIGTLYSAKLTINNPKEIDLHGQQQPSQEQMQKLFHQVKANGHDGVILHNVREFNGLGTQYVVFNPGQIKIISKYNNQNKEQGVAEDTYDNKFDAMMSKVTSKKSLNAREALELMDELIYQGGATYLEALDQASTSFEIDPAKLDKLYQQQAGSLDENESKPVDMKRWLRAYERNEDRNFHTENMLAVAKLVGDENDINAMKRMVRDQNDLGYLTDEQFAIRQVLYKKLWPLVKQKIQTSQTQSLEEEDPCWKGYHQYGMKDKNGKQVPNCVPVKETKSNILKGLM